MTIKFFTPSLALPRLFLWQTNVGTGIGSIPINVATSRSIQDNTMLPGWLS
jgi:hypothetical protein